MQSDEIELKFPVSDPVAFHRKLEELSFHLDTPRTFESNTLYDTPTRSLREQKQILRIRHYGNRWVVTHKRQPDIDDLPSKYKVRVETESEVEDGPSLGRIFEQLGYTPVFRYEKFRTEWSDPLHPNGHLVVDETAIGTFAELEGPPAWIDQTLERLAVNPASCLTESYGKLFLAWKEQTGSPAEHFTFDEIAASKTTA
jgi:adenylate cyclase, class 2